ncbi:hypothetical protein PFICI_04926 [Pestalotiopsis fici W106-1]|uniref:Nuclease S1 n=1 Tax=Pestalotiopsis fici (strain W106-1 / CGMCC3.15140) TaxID=1229662 RepID=W3XAG8_PESFW|nr:uncharacterized protein PFICI_04926 [Pestalotiopsis fici W106-1]ETS83050.1 hypothetical protein PFICI_04926 [Pestalotiopsis fici W106-1]
MRLGPGTAALSLLLPSVAAWGRLGHITVAYIATNFVKEETASYFKDLLGNDTEHYLAGVATWADNIRSEDWARFTETFHFIDAKDSPPKYCGVDFTRDCKAHGCVVSAIQNYTSQLLDNDLDASQRNEAAKFIIHFIGDIHQPLHTEDVAQGGNKIHVKWGHSQPNLHHVWDTSIAEQILGDNHEGDGAYTWASDLTSEIIKGKYAAKSKSWLGGLQLDDPITTSMNWANETNSYVCTHVLPEGPSAIVGQQLAGGYAKKAEPVIEILIAQAGYRLAAWLDLIASRLNASGIREDGQAVSILGDEL